ncbi:TonB-dependent receptor [Silvibacterium acidisoli]|uniref:TonB-dependent receptor n=1 Tax=Acidobacteriaceae bacterium ZG23-2 TaxID=2883246 RepID=UPI00406D3E0C
MRKFLGAGALALILSCSGAASGQANSGEIRLHIAGPQQQGVRASVDLTSGGNQYQNRFTTSASGTADLSALPYGIYLVRVQAPGFTTVTRTIEVRTAFPIDYALRLDVAPVTTTVEVNEAATLVDPHDPSSTMQIGTTQIGNRVNSLPGRSVQDLVNSQPGWLYEGNAVLHPRGSEYQTQFVIDGIPLTDNRSPSFGPDIEADDLDSMSIYTAGFPAEYGRKMGGVVEMNTRRETSPGLHGQVVLAGGSYDTASSYAQAQQVWGRNTFGASAAGNMTSHYLNPVVPQNFTNNGTAGDFSLRFDRDLTASDTLRMSVRHELSRYQIPNEFVQQDAGQRQYGDNFETMGTVLYQHIFSPDVLADFSGMVRNNSNDLYSNPDSTPIIAFQHNYFNEGYFKGAVSFHEGRQEWKAGIESDAMFLHEKFSYTITNPDDFDDGTPLTAAFTGNRPDLEQSAFVQDMIRLGDWTISAGLRWDHYQLLLNQNAVSPRITIGKFFQKPGIVLHASYDRVFQTPSFENILISSSNFASTLNPDFLHLPVQPSKGNYYEGGLTKGFSKNLRLDMNIYRRDVRNYADDDQLLNTGVSYPIAFDKAIIYGAEAKVDLVQWQKLSGFASYSYQVGNAWYPVTGGLFLGDDVSDAETQLRGHFPDSQDQRNTLRLRFQYDLLPRVWFAGGMNYGSGLPFEFDGDQQQAAEEYGPDVINRINFNRGRVDPSLDVNASLGLDLYKSDRMKMNMQADGTNLNDRLNVIDFGGLFSGNAIAPGRSFFVRLKTSF